MDKPKLTRDELMAKLAPYIRKFDGYDLFIAFWRGYRKNTMGVPGQNDRNIYDDAAFIVSKGGGYFPYNANVDPSKYRSGVGFGENKGIASIKANMVFYSWILDYHKNQYLALCQRRGPIAVIRDGNPPYEQISAYLGVNNHEGPINSTGSLGCCTIPKTDYPEYINTVVSEMTKHYGDILLPEPDKFGRPIYKDIIVPFIILEN